MQPFVFLGTLKIDFLVLDLSGFSMQMNANDLPAFIIFWKPDRSVRTQITTWINNFVIQNSCPDKHALHAHLLPVL